MSNLLLARVEKYGWGLSSVLTNVSTLRSIKLYMPVLVRNNKVVGLQPDTKFLSHLKVSQADLDLTHAKWDLVHWSYDEQQEELERATRTEHEAIAYVYLFVPQRTMVLDGSYLEVYFDRGTTSRLQVYHGLVYRDGECEAKAEEWIGDVRRALVTFTN